MLDIATMPLEKALEALVDKFFTNLKDIAGYQIDKLHYDSMCKEAYNKLADLDQVKTINDFEDSISLYDFYVEPQLISDITGLKQAFIVNSLDDFSCSKKILISGIVGQGKSILMRHLAISESFKGNRFPIFVELRELGEDSLENFMRKSIKSWLKIDNDKLIAHLLKEGKIIFFFDGFDEIEIPKMEKTVREFEKISKKYEKLDFIVSSRPEESIDKSTIFKKFLIKKLDLNDQLKIIKKLVKDYLIQENLVKSLSSASDDIKNILVTPLMVNFYVYLYKSDQIISEDLKLFYDKLFDLVLRKHDGTKLLYKREYATKLSTEKLQNAFECLCYLCCKRETFFFGEYVFRELVEKTIKFNKFNCSIDNLIRDFTTGICFIGREGQSYAFMHTSIPDFFSAKFISKNKDIDGLFDDLKNNYKKYENVLNYLKKIDEKCFYINYIDTILEESYDFFKSKEILDEIYYSIKYYNNKYSEDQFIKKVKNPIKILIILKGNVNSYFAFHFINYIRNPLQIYLDKRFKYANSYEFQMIYSDQDSTETNFKSEKIDSDKFKSENYYLYEKIEDESEHGKCNKEQVDNTIKIENFEKINAKYNSDLSQLKLAISIYNSKLDKIKEKIDFYKKPKSINDLF